MQLNQIETEVEIEVFSGFAAGLVAEDACEQAGLLAAGF
jgi:hypothetical protein